MELSKKTLDFSSLDSIIDYQFYSQTKGMLLTENNSLYEFNENDIKELNTPKNINITQVHFLSSTEGAISGYMVNPNHEKASLLNGSLFVWLILLLIIFFKSKNYIKEITLITLVTFVACKSSSNPTLDGDRIEKTEKVELTTGSHKYLANKDYVRPVISITKDGGKTWETNEMPTNFYITDIKYLKNNFLISTFANPYDNMKDRPIHGDGDLWLYDFHSFSKDYKPSKFANHFGVNGIEINDGEVYLYGTERTATLFKKNQLEGNITKLNDSIQGDFHLINTPHKTAVTSLSVNDGVIWCILDNKEEVIANHEIHYQFVSKKKLISYKDDNWKECSLPEEPKEVIFLPTKKTGFVISQTGSLYSTISGSESWEKLSNIDELITGKRFDDMITFLSRKNQIIIYSNSI